MGGELTLSFETDDGIALARKLDSVVAEQRQHVDTVLDRVNAVSELFMAMTREVAELRKTVEAQTAVVNTLLTNVNSTKAAAADASAHSSNVAVDIAELTTAVNDLSARVESTERTVRGLKIYKSVQSEWDS